MKKYKVDNGTEYQICEGLQEAVDAHYKLVLPLYNQGRDRVLHEWFIECGEKVTIEDLDEEIRSDETPR